MRIFGTGDCHGMDAMKVSNKRFPIGKDLTREDVMVFLGDFGYLWCDPPDAQEKYALKWLNEKQYTSVVVLGNHENYDRVFNLPTEIKWGKPVYKLRDNVYILQRGRVYTFGDQKVFTMGGGLSVDKQHRTLNKTWWEQEMPSPEELGRGLEELKEVNYEVDQVWTHVPPNEVKYLGLFAHPMKGKWIEDPLETWLHSNVAQGTYFKKWYFGHYHVDQEVTNKYTCLYNSIIELGADKDYKSNSFYTALFPA